MPVKPSDREEEFFARHEFDKRKKAQEDLQQKIRDDERVRLKDLHYMHCPKCGMDLLPVEYKGVTLDKCSACGGLWFDAQEFETILALEQSGIAKIFSVFGRS
jgi:hypothetical protein